MTCTKCFDEDHPFHEDDCSRCGQPAVVVGHYEDNGELAFGACEDHYDELAADFGWDA